MLGVPLFQTTIEVSFHTSATTILLRLEYLATGLFRHKFACDLGQESDAKNEELFLFCLVSVTFRSGANMVQKVA